MRTVRAGTIREAYLQAVNTVLRNGYEVADERGSNTREVLNLSTHISFPEGPTNDIFPAEDIPKGSVWNTERLESYVDEFINPDNRGFIYTYGERLFGFDTNQIEDCIIRLGRNCRTRRATAVTLRPMVDYLREDIPCLVMVDFKIRDRMLYTTGIWRSHDIYGAYFPNLVGLYNLAKYVQYALEYVVDIGPISTHSVSAHVYEYDVDQAEKLLKENGVNPFGGAY